MFLPFCDTKIVRVRMKQASSPAMSNLDEIEKEKMHHTVSVSRDRWSTIRRKCQENEHIYLAERASEREHVIPG